MNQDIIRRAREGDIPQICRLLVQVNGVHAALRPDLFTDGERKYSDGQLKAILADDLSPVFVCERDGAILGYAFCRILDEGGGGRKKVRTLYLDDLCVDGEVRGSGTGTQLFACVQQYARSIGAYNLTLHVYEGNVGAENFYKKQGMKPLYHALEKIL